MSKGSLIKIPVLGAGDEGLSLSLLIILGKLWFSVFGLQDQCFSIKLLEYFRFNILFSIIPAMGIRIRRMVKYRIEAI